MNLDFPYCVYSSTHPSGAYYLGKGMTSKVVNGEYRGSGVRLQLALTLDAYNWDTWTTVVIDTFPTEDLAFQAEAKLVPHDLLADPMCLNSQQGGKFGRHFDHGALLRRIKQAKKRAVTLEKKEKKALKTQQQKRILAEKTALIRQQQRLLKAGSTRPVIKDTMTKDKVEELKSRLKKVNK